MIVTDSSEQNTCQYSETTHYFVPSFQASANAQLIKCLLTYTECSIREIKSFKNEPLNVFMDLYGTL